MIVYIVVGRDPDTGEIIEVDTVWSSERRALDRAEHLTKESRQPLCVPVNYEVEYEELHP